MTFPFEVWRQSVNGIAQGTRVLIQKWMPILHDEIVCGLPVEDDEDYSTTGLLFCPSHFAFILFPPIFFLSFSLFKVSYALPITFGDKLRVSRQKRKKKIVTDRPRCSERLSIFVVIPSVTRGPVNMVGNCFSLRRNLLSKGRRVLLCDLKRTFFYCLILTIISCIVLQWVSRTRRGFPSSLLPAAIINRSINRQEFLNLTAAPELQS